MTSQQDIHSALHKVFPDSLEDCHAKMAELYTTLDFFAQQFGVSLERAKIRDGVPDALYDLFCSEEKSGETAAVADKQVPGKEGEATPVSDKTKRKGHGRAKIAPELRREEVRLELHGEDCKCPRCGTELREFGCDECEQYYMVAASLLVIRYLTVKYSCPQCKDAVYTASRPPEPIEKSNAHSSLLAWIILSKYCDHLPLYRQSQILQRLGAQISRKTMSDWMMRCAELLLPVAVLMRLRLGNCHAVHIDDTHVMQHRGKTNKEDGERKRGLHRGHLWTVIGDDNAPYIVYDYQQARNRAGPKRLLGDFDGYVQADACGVYDEFFKDGPATEVGCWKHARDYFKDALVSNPVRARHALDTIQSFYDIERQVRDGDDAQRLARRQRDSKPLVDSFFEWIDEELLATLPRSPIAKAMSYARNNRIALERFLEDGRLSIDNNPAERAFCPVATGRRNWLFVGSEGGGDATAVFFTLIQSAKRNGLNPHEYIADLLERISTHPQSRIEELLPDNWTPVDKPAAVSDIQAVLDTIAAA